MKFHEYLEATHVSTNISIQIEYSPSKQAKIIAASNLVNAQRKILTWLQYPIVLISYVMVQFKVLPLPLSATEQIAAYNEKVKVKMDAALATTASKLQAVPDAPKDPA